MKRIAVLISNKGTGSNLEAILTSIEKGKIKNGKVVVVVSDKKDAYGLVRAKKRKIATYVFPLKNNKSNKVRQKYDDILGAILKKKYRIDLVVLAGWMIILSENFIKYFPGKIINLHPGLLPDNGDYMTLRNGERIKAIRGLHTNSAVQYAIDHNYPATGSTVHFITPKVDDGKVLLRSEVKIRKEDTVESLYKRMKQEEHKILPKAIEMYCSGVLSRGAKRIPHPVWNRSYTSGSRLRILIIGSGGREHALVWKIAQSPQVEKIYCAPGNPGTGEIAENLPIPVSQLDHLVQFAKDKKIDLTVVGPEAPLIDGIVDLFQKENLTIIGPTKKAAQIEGSKAFAKKLMKKYSIPTATYELFKNFGKAITYMEKQTFPIVIKTSGQAFGKGVLVATEKKEAIDFLQKVMVDKIFGSSGDEVVIEECLFGPEVSIMVATDGKDFVSFLPSQDHKRVYDFDRGPNTGGIGAYAPVPFVSHEMMQRIEKEIVTPTLDGMKKEGYPFQGILYPGLVLTKEGPKVLEFNCRFGDPEIQPLMALLKTDLLDIVLAIKNKTIKNMKLKWQKGFAVCVVLTSGGYPAVYEKGKEIKGLNIVKKAEGLTVFHSGTKRQNNKIVSSGGRVLGITVVDKTLKKAIKKAYTYIGKKGTHFSGMHYRKDIGKKGLALKI